MVGVRVRRRAARPVGPRARGRRGGVQQVQRRQRELDGPGAEVLPPREALLARLVCLGHDARHRVAALRGVRLAEQRGARTERVLAHLDRVRVGVRVRC